ncbi:phosphoadenosine phosphosulfate reductase family protein [Candidatus Bathyarchaeota archaeon]|nr:phosphoadenosine phosphosulfate reductase family protein [Candidatus Bathyarchaeota archaeon]
MVTQEETEKCTELVKKSKEIVKEAFEKCEPDEIAVTWTGGKDSTLQLWVIRQFCVENNIDLPKVMTIDEGDAFPEINDFLITYSKKWNVDLHWMTNFDVLAAAMSHLNNTVLVKDLNERNKAELKRIGSDKESFTFEAESYEGNHLMKTVMFNTFIENHDIKLMFVALRRDEHAARKDDSYFTYKEGGYLVPEHTRVSAILDFTERDLWNTYHIYNIPYCSLYEIGYRSLGARSTSNPGDIGVTAWKQDLENVPERAGRRQDKEKSMARMRRLGYM